MAIVADPRLAVLHGLRLKGVAEVESVAEVAALPVARAQGVLAELAGTGLVVHREGRFGGWSITPSGRSEHERLVATEVDQAGVRDEIEAAYRRFLVLNPELLAVCTRWQVRDGDGSSVVNDHDDASYDAAVVEELAALHARALPVLDELAAQLPRFGRYRPALTEALTAVRAGQLDMFTKPLAPSYHTLWFELHEDLLATLGLDRTTEVVA
jgi:hypothetical protein